MFLGSYQVFYFQLVSVVWHCWIFFFLYVVYPKLDETCLYDPSHFLLPPSLLVKTYMACSAQYCASVL